VVALLLMGTVREVLGAGAFLGVPLFGPRYEPWVVMILPPGGFFTLALLLLSFSWWKRRKAAQRGVEPVGALAAAEGRAGDAPCLQPAEVA